MNNKIKYREWYYRHFDCKKDYPKEIRYNYTGKRPNVFHCGFCESRCYQSVAQGNIKKEYPFNDSNNSSSE